MRIRTFMAETMAEAMDQVRIELGPDAIIISTAEGKRGRGAEVRAAIEEEDIAPGYSLDLANRFEFHRGVNL